MCRKMNFEKSHMQRPVKLYGGLGYSQTATINQFSYENEVEKPEKINFLTRRQTIAFSFKDLPELAETESTQSLKEERPCIKSNSSR